MAELLFAIAFVLVLNLFSGVVSWLAVRGLQFHPWNWRILFGYLGIPSYFRWRDRKLAAMYPKGRQQGSENPEQQAQRQPGDHA